MPSQVDEERSENGSSTSCRSMFIKIGECFGRVVDTCLIPRFPWLSGRHRNDSTTYSRGSTATAGRNAVGGFERGDSREDVALLPPTSPGMDFANGKRSAEVCTGYTSKKGMSDEYDATCPTCLEEYDVENPKCWTRCGHHFHVPCIYEWLERSQDCPVCSRKIDPDSLVIDSDLV
eukprot:jgi/Picsp_1/5097/NSC_02460-R1_ring u-box domain-containing protein